jgi:hypothetical protein
MNGLCFVSYSVFRISVGVWGVGVKIRKQSRNEKKLGHQPNTYSDKNQLFT